MLIFKQLLKRLILNQSLAVSVVCAVFIISTANAEDGKDGITVNGDNVEYLSQEKQVSATGNVEVLYKGSRLTCDNLKANTMTKDTQAYGNVKLEDRQSVIFADQFDYNMQSKAGRAVNANFYSFPYFGKAAEIDKVNDKEFIAKKTHFTTCSYDKPHYRMTTKEIDYKTGERITARNSTFRLANMPLFYLPYYSQSLHDPLMHVQLTPGSRKGWGPFLLSAWRYDITDNINGRIYLDYRSKLGIAEGFGSAYSSEALGKGNLKAYYAHEKDSSLEEGTPDEFQRYLIRWRHKWDIDPTTGFVGEYYKITDSKRALLGADHNILKDYFYREYETDSQPLSYALLHKSFSYSTLDVLMQKRTNRWYEQLEKLPEVKYSMTNVPIGESPFYYENTSQYANLNYKYPVPSLAENDLSVNRFDTFNKVSLPSRVGFVELTPFAGTRQTFYDRDVNNGSVSPRTIFYTGADASTKFYRVFDVRSDLLGMDINGLRHVISPMVKYGYNHEPTVAASMLKQFDTLDAITRSNLATLELTNKLQTKRNGAVVDLLEFRVDSDYYFRPKAQSSGSRFGDILFHTVARPYTQLRLTSDMRYDHVDDYCKEINYDINYAISTGSYIGFGQRYVNKLYDNNYSGNQLTLGAGWKINPKWKLEFYERYQVNPTTEHRDGFLEQQYMLSRDLHCWIMDLAYSVKRDTGNTVWLIFRLKAFPEMELGFDQSYRAPSPGSQS